METKEIRREKFSAGQILRFVIPSIIGVLLLMTPFKLKGESTVMVSILSKGIQAGVGNLIPIYVLVLIAITFSLLLAIIYKVAKPDFIEKNEALKDVANISAFWFVIRIVGFVLAFTVAFGEKTGLPEIIWSGDTGGLILFDLIGGLFTIFLVAGFILPFLTEFGLLEYIGVFLTKFMRPVFRLPGRSAVDCVASWIGDGTIGVALTNKQYEEGYYSAREAAVISTTFSAVSITFCLVVLDNVKLVDYFGQFYFTVILAGVICALLVPRIPPLSFKKDSYFKGDKQDIGETIPKAFTRPQWGLHLAVKKAESNGNAGQYLKNGFKTVAGLWLGVIPSIMAIGTIVLIVSSTTPIFDWFGVPFKPLLELLKVPMAQEASTTMVIGFADMVVPSIMAAQMADPMTQFIVAAVSVVQLIYMSETGAVILGSNLPVSFIDLFVLFLERTIISLPIIVLMAHLVF